MRMSKWSLLSVVSLLLVITKGGRFTTIHERLHNIMNKDTKLQMHFSDSQKINDHFDFNPNSKFVYLRSYESIGSESIDVTTIEDNTHNHRKVGNAEDSDNFILISAVIGIIIVVLIILIVALYFYGNRERQIPPEVENELDITYSKRSTELTEELNKNEMDDRKLGEAYAGVAKSNKDNYHIFEDMNENEKEVSVKEGTDIFTDLTITTESTPKSKPKEEIKEDTKEDLIEKSKKKLKERDKAIVVREDNKLLNPERTIFYKLIVSHMDEFENIEMNDDLSDDDKQNEIDELLLQKTKYFVTNLEKIYYQLNLRLKGKIESAKEKFDGPHKLDRETVEQIIGNLWIQEDLGLYEVGNAAILTDLFYVVMGKKVEPKFYLQANFGRKYKGLREILEILANFGAGFCFLSSCVGRERAAEVELYRGDNLPDENNYIANNHYRFITFQSCSDKMNIAASYLSDENSAFYTIQMPSNGENSIRLVKVGNPESDEYLIMPYTRFKLEGTPDAFKHINSMELDEEKEEKVREAKQYEMSLSKEQFYKDKVKARWWKRFIENFTGKHKE